MTPAEIEAEAARLRAAFRDSGPHAGWHAVAKASLQAREEHEAAKREICERVLFVGPEVVPTSELAQRVATAVEHAAEVEREVLKMREDAVAFRAARSARAEVALQKARRHPKLALQVACEMIGGDVTLCTSEENAQAAIEDRARLLRAFGATEALLDLARELELDDDAIGREPGGMTVTNVADAVRRTRAATESERIAVAVPREST